MKASNMREIVQRFVTVAIFSLAPISTLYAQELLQLPPDEELREHVASASNWLGNHVVSGTLKFDDKEVPLSIVAWKDPTLHAGDLNYLAGYTITDTLWASYALQLTRPEIAEQLVQSLQRIDCDGNLLQEVIWKSIPEIRHRPADVDFVHGHSLGTMQLSDGRKIDVRKFDLLDDPTYAIGHPKLFAEHAVYQAIFEYRQGKSEAARNRIRSIFDESSVKDGHKIKWHQKQMVLVDNVNTARFEKFANNEKDRCRQFCFKIALVVYATRLLGLEDEFRIQISQMQNVLLRSQQADGGMSHYVDMNQEGEVIQGVGCTGEASAIFVLAACVRPHKDH